MLMAILFVARGLMYLIVYSCLVLAELMANLIRSFMMVNLDIVGPLSHIRLSNIRIMRGKFISIWVIIM